ncbi:MutS-related protein [Echinicola salinicaeni]|uniref:MutS-related protein n=1 Tax=Echinicola salinicaeni TaxID=2762757 RepID=UPI0016493FE8|nr:DNA mismatch repair protein MutS [Echinicola salinicaeni]
MTFPKDEFQNKLSIYKQASNEIAVQLKRISLIRLIVFIMGLISSLYLANERMIISLVIVLAVFTALYIFTLKHFQNQEKNCTFKTNLIKINEEEILRCENKLNQIKAPNTNVSSSHDYSQDMDLFGTHSLFKLLNRTTTERGKEILIHWMLTPASPNEIQERQKLIQEMLIEIDWRQSLNASGMEPNEEVPEKKHLTDWINIDNHLLSKKMFLIGLALILSIITVFSLGYFFYHLVSLGEIKGLWLTSGILFINTLFLNRLRPTAEKNVSHSFTIVNLLASYHRLISVINQKTFSSSLMKSYTLSLKDKDYNANKEIKILINLLTKFRLRGAKGQSIGANYMYILFNYIFFLDVYFLLQIEAWRKKNKNHIKQWEESIAQVEAISSLAGFSYANPNFNFPIINKSLTTLKFKNLGHPLLKESKRVNNNFNLEEGQIAMITGSNMAGKSTFLRAIGTNLILGLMGAPCCASSAEIYPFRLFSSMRIKDDLEEGVSSFYAELQRITTLLDKIKSDEPVFFLLDELFKGTNSKDRNKGGYSLIKQLKRLGATGLISTHDLELAQLVSSHNMISNYSFNSSLCNEELSFTYKLEEGICKDFNASELMKNAGIEIIEQF